MYAQERLHGPFRIHGRARQAPAGGFIAAVAVHRVQGAGTEPVFSSEALYGGEPFECAKDALACALHIGYREIRLANEAVC